MRIIKVLIIYQGLCLNKALEETNVVFVKNKTDKNQLSIL